MDDIKIVIYEYLFKRRDLLDLQRLAWKETNLEEQKRMEEEIASLERDVENKHQLIISTEEGNDALIDIEGKTHGSDILELETMYYEAIAERNKKQNQNKTESLTDKFIKQDTEKLGLENCKISTMKKEDLEKQLDEEFRNYNADILYENEDTADITIMEGISKDGKKVSLYYYPYKNYKLRR